MIGFPCHIDQSKVHTGEKPYQCTVFFQSFAWIATLKRHMRIHSNKKWGILIGQFSTLSSGKASKAKGC
jgi:uncharacterized Zn-finger protein